MSNPSNQAKEIFLAALEEHTPEQWPAFLEQACAGNALLRAEIEKLLQARAEMGSFHEAPSPLLATVDEALAKLARGDAAAARLVELRYFAGLTVDEAGKALGMSTATAYRHWNYARAWLHGELQEM